MKILPHAIEVTGRLELTKRELELLEHTFSYDNQDKFADGIVSSVYHGGVSKKELLEFWKALHANVGTIMNNIEANKKDLFQR